MPHNLTPYSHSVKGEYAFASKRCYSVAYLLKYGRIVISLRTNWYLFFRCQLNAANLYLGLPNDKIDRTLSLVTASSKVFSQYLFGR
jgi:hypothetical protein